MTSRTEIPLYDAEFTMTEDADSPENHAALFQFDKETGQTSVDVVDHVLINSETRRIRQFQARSMGRAVVGLYDKINHWGDMVVTTNREK